jgi:hypothetical protein
VRATRLQDDVGKGAPREGLSDALPMGDAGTGLGGDARLGAKGDVRLQSSGELRLEEKSPVKVPWATKLTPSAPSKLLASIEAACEGAAPTPGPALPAECANALRDAASWYDRPIALTSQGEGKPGRLWIMLTTAADKPKKFWFEIPPPEGFEIAGAGAMLAVRGNELHVYGGTADGQVSQQHLVYDLAVGLRHGFPSGHWRLDEPLRQPAAWGAAVATESGSFVLGGIKSFDLKGTEATRVAIDSRYLQRDRSGMWDNGYSELAKSATGAHAIAYGTEIIVGPGASLDGQFMRYRVGGRGEGYREIPPLKEPGGLGSLALEGRTLIYYGGFSKDGEQRSVHTLDLDDPKARWNYVGEADCLGGRSRIVNCYGRPLALMVRPGKTASFYLG